MVLVATMNMFFSSPNIEQYDIGVFQEKLNTGKIKDLKCVGGDSDTSCKGTTVDDKAFSVKLGKFDQSQFFNKDGRKLFTGTLEFDEKGTTFIAVLMQFSSMLKSLV